MKQNWSINLCTCTDGKSMQFNQWCMHACVWPVYHVLRRKALLHAYRTLVKEQDGGRLTFNKFLQFMSSYQPQLGVVYRLLYNYSCYGFIVLHSHSGAWGDVCISGPANGQSWHYERTWWKRVFEPLSMSRAEMGIRKFVILGVQGWSVVKTWIHPNAQSSLHGLCSFVSCTN